MMLIVDFEKKKKRSKRKREIHRIAFSNESINIFSHSLNKNFKYINNSVCRTKLKCTLHFIFHTKNYICTAS